MPQHRSSARSSRTIDVGNCSAISMFDRSKHCPDNYLAVMSRHCGKRAFDSPVDINFFIEGLNNDAHLTIVIFSPPHKIEDARQY